MKFSLLKKSIVLVFLVLLIDQIVKIWIKTHMTLGQEIPVLGNWFILHFTENPGMAFGLQFGGNYGKLMLSLFRIGAIAFLAWYIIRLIRQKANFGVVACFSLIFAGAMGNMIDSAFYGLIFSNSSFFEVAQAFPPDGGYGTFLHGKVVDMLYFPLFSGQFPSWFPVWGGQQFSFFDPVFNIADSSVFIGVASLLLFQRKYFKGETRTIGETEKEDVEISPETEENN